MVAENIKKIRDQQPRKTETPLKVKVNDLVMVKDPDAAAFQPRYQPNYRVTAIFGNNRIEVQDEKGQKSVRRSAHVKAIEPKDKLIAQIPTEEVIECYGRGAKLLIAQKDIPDVQFQQLETEGVEVDNVEIESDEYSSPLKDNNSLEEGSTLCRVGLPVPGMEGDEHSTPSAQISTKNRL